MKVLSFLRLSDLGLRRVTEDESRRALDGAAFVAIGLLVCLGCGFILLSHLPFAAFDIPILLRRGERECILNYFVFRCNRFSN